MHIGCAGWTLPRDVRASFGSVGTHLARYAERFSAVEINSSFYGPHQPATYARWRDSVPDSFLFSVKIPKVITHELRLVGATDVVKQFLQEACNLRDKLGCLLVQLPPSLAFDRVSADSFLRNLRDRFYRTIVVEARHASWFAADATAILTRHRIQRVLADPAAVDGVETPFDSVGDVAEVRTNQDARYVLGNGDEADESSFCNRDDNAHPLNDRNRGDSAETRYIRLHGSPRTYYSSYSDESLLHIATRLRAEWSRGRDVWCVFDNTALGAATTNALALLVMVSDVAGT